MSNDMNFDLNNLELDDNTLELLPDGDYHFTVDSHTIEYSQSDKFPPNTQVIVCSLAIPIIKDGDLKTVYVRHNLNVAKKTLFSIRQFAECIGMCPEKGKFAFNVDKIDGREGICNMTQYTNKSGKTFNNVQITYAPSKAPAITANDDAWAKRQANGGFGDGADWPFGN